MYSFSLTSLLQYASNRPDSWCHWKSCQAKEEELKRVTKEAGDSAEDEFMGSVGNHRFATRVFPHLIKLGGPNGWWIETLPPFSQKKMAKGRSKIRRLQGREGNDLSKNSKLHDLTVEKPWIFGGGGECYEEQDILLRSQCNQKKYSFGVSFVLASKSVFFNSPIHPKQKWITKTKHTKQDTRSLTSRPWKSTFPGKDRLPQGRAVKPFQENYNTPGYRTPQAIPLANYEMNPIISLLVKVARGVFQFGVFPHLCRSLGSSEIRRVAAELLHHGHFPRF